MDLNQKMYQAIMDGNLNAVQALLAVDSSLVNLRTPSGVPVVLFAMYYNQLPMVESLLARGAQVDVFTAAALGLIDRLAAILTTQPGQVDAVAPDGYSPLGLACFFGREQAVDLLLMRGANVNKAAENPQQVTPLHSACAGEHGEHTSIARKLVEHGANVNARQAGDFTPLHAAAQNGNLTLVDLLLAHRAEVNAHTSEGHTPLYYAREGGHEAVIAALAANGGIG